MGPDSRCVASEAGSFTDDESPELLTLQVASRTPFVRKDDFTMSPFLLIFCEPFLSKLKMNKKI